jgi:ABC-type molybdate transport system substrate-binding protein
VLLPAEKEPAAQYARQVLEMEGLWETVKGKVSYGSTVRDCYRDLVADKADAGFAYLGCPVPTDPGKADYAGVKTVLVLKQDRDGATTAYAARSKTGRYAELADQLLTFLLQPTSATELAVAGLVPPTDVSPSLQAQ